MSEERRQEITQALTEGSFCTFCGGIHAGLSMPACPRIAACEIDADGKIRQVSFWPDGEYDTSGSYTAADAETDDEPG